MNPKPPLFSGIQTKIVFLFLFFSILIIIVGTVAYLEIQKTNLSVLSETETLRESAVKQSIESLEKLGADMIRQQAKDVAEQLDIYIDENPNMSVEDLQKDEKFLKIAIQPVGKTGYTAITDVDTLINRAHPQPNIVNLDLSTLAEKLPGFWGIMLKVKGGNTAEGYYDWQDPDGTIRKKFMYISVLDSRTRDGAKLSVAATTYIDEFSQPMFEAEKNLNQASKVTKEKVEGALSFITALMISITVLMVVFLLIIYFFVRSSISEPLSELLQVAKDVGEGELSARAKTGSSDEIGQLAQAFNTMAEKLKDSYSGLEEKVNERARALEGASKELRARLEQLEKLQEASADKDLKVAELRKEIERLKGGGSEIGGEVS